LSRRLLAFLSPRLRRSRAAISTRSAGTPLLYLPPEQLQRIRGGHLEVRNPGPALPEGRTRTQQIENKPEADCALEDLIAAAEGDFGSGWAWLVRDPSGRLRVRNCSDADNLLRSGSTPLLTLDVWEHAYYLDYQNERGRYIEGFLDHLVN